MSPRNEPEERDERALDDRLIDQALERHFAAPPKDLAPRVVAALAAGTPAPLTPDEVARLLAPPARGRARPWLVLTAAAALVAALFWLQRNEPPPEPAPPPLVLAPVPEARFEALLTALFEPGAHPPTEDPGLIVRELGELARALAEEPARWPRLDTALLAPERAGAAVAPLDFLHVLTDPRALAPARALWQRDPGAFADIHLASFAELGDADFRAEAEALVANAEREPCSAPVFSAAYLALHGDARGTALLDSALLDSALLTPCPDDPARALAATFALLALGASDADARWLTLVRTTVEDHLARGRRLRAAAWLEADAALRAWCAAPETFRLARLHLELLEREERRRATPLDADALARELAALKR